MIRDPNSTEYVRIALPPIERSKEEIGRLLVDALDRSHALSREKQDIIEAYRIKQEAIGREIALLIREAKDGPPARHQDIACEVWYDLEAGERVLVNAGDDPGEVSRRPMTPQEIQEFGGAMVQDTVL